jgi:S1-C subfamily serine protease
MNNPQVQQMIQNPQFMQMVMQMMAGQGGRGGQGGAGNLGGMLGGAQQGARGGRGQLGGGQMGGGNLGAMMQNPQIQQMLQQLLANGGGLGGARQGGLARNAPAPPPAAAMSTDLTATFGVRVGDANGGVRVVDVKANTPAANAGLKTGDLIVAVNGRQVASGDELKDALTASGATVKLDVQRRGDVITLSAKK